MSSEEAAMNHHRVPNAATRLHMPALLTQCSDMKYVHVRVTHAFCCRQNECISLGVNSEDRWLITYANAAELINREKDVSHWDIQAVEVIVDWLQNGPAQICIGFQWSRTRFFRISVAPHKFVLDFSGPAQMCFGFQWYRTNLYRISVVPHKFLCRLGFFSCRLGVSKSCAPTPHAAASRLCRHSAQTHTPEKCVCAVSCFLNF